MTRTSPSSATWTNNTVLQNTDAALGAARSDAGPVAEISLPTIVSNYRALKSLAPSAECSAVVKANAYGHGAAQVSATLFEAGCRTFFVAYPHEGETVRNAVGPEPTIYVFNGVHSDALDQFAACRLSPVCNRMEEIETWLRSELAPPYALHFDTGINRLGLRLTDLQKTVEAVSARPPALVMSHLACADKPDAEENQAQLDRFQEVRKAFPGIRASFCSTGGIYLGANFHFDLMRPGIGLYGGGPAYPSGIRLKPALTLTAPILSVFDIQADDTVGYGATFKAKTDMTVATVSLGYADGYLRSASNFGFGILNNTPCPILGRVSMDLITIDVSDLVDRPKQGERVEFIGPKAGLEIQAEAAGTIGYELTSRLGGRISMQWRTEE